MVVSLKSRSIEAGLAVTRSRAAEQWLRRRGAGHVLFKICSTFNSTDAGNIGPVMDALRADSGDAIVLVTPAFPGTGRTVYQGNLFVGAVPLNESPLKDHPLNPMHEFQPGAGAGAPEPDPDRAGRSRGIGARTGCRSRTARRTRRERHRRCHCRCGVRSRSRDHRHGGAGLPAVGRRVRHWTGPRAGAAGGGDRRRSVASNPVFDAAVGGAAACLAGSCSQATLQQVASAERIMPVLHLDPERIVSGTDEARRAIGWAKRAAAARPGPDRQQRDAGAGRSSAVPSWPRCSRACDRAGDGRHRGSIGAGRRAAAGGGRRRNLRRGGGSAGKFPAFWSVRRSPPACRCCVPSAPATAPCCLP